MMPDHRPDPVLPLVAPDAGAHHVFVYGTLRAGGRNDIARFRPLPRFVGNASACGTLYDFGGWPGLRLARAGEADRRVLGEVYRIDPSIEPTLDRLEGVQADGNGDYLKCTIALDVLGRTIQCLVYEINPRLIAGRPIIADGDWIAHSRG